MLFSKQIFFILLLLIFLFFNSILILNCEQIHHSYQYNLTSDQKSEFNLQNDTEDESEIDEPGTSTVTYFSEVIMMGDFQHTQYNKADLERGYEEFHRDDFDGQHNHVGDVDYDDQKVQETNNNLKETHYANETHNSYIKSGSERSFEYFYTRCSILSSILLLILK